MSMINRKEYSFCGFSSHHGPFLALRIFSFFGLLIHLPLHLAQKRKATNFPVCYILFSPDDLLCSFSVISSIQSGATASVEWSESPIIDNGHGTDRSNNKPFFHHSNHHQRRFVFCPFFSTIFRPTWTTLDRLLYNHYPRSSFIDNNINCGHTPSSSNATDQQQQQRHCAAAPQLTFPPVNQSSRAN